MKQLIVFFISLIHIILLLLACEQDAFKKRCMDVQSLLLQAKQRVKVSNAKNLYSEGKIVSTTVTSDISLSKNFIDSRRTELRAHYNAIKEHIDNRDERYTDALFVITLVNEMTYLLSGETIDDSCKYLVKIKEEKGKLLSIWVQNDIFGPFLTTKNGLKKWRNMNHVEKQEQIYKVLMVFYDDHKCSEKAEHENRQIQP